MQIPKSALWYTSLYFLLSMGCGKKEKNTIIWGVGHSVVGTWTKQPADSSSIFLALKNDNNYQLYLDGWNPNQVVSGTYSIQNGEISFTDEDGPSTCTENPGVYKFILEGGIWFASLTFISVSDTCNSRSSIVPGYWVISP